MKIIAPSLITLALESWVISPSVTFDPATLPTFETLNISNISAVPIIFNGKIGSIFREKNQTKQVSAGVECGITLKDFVDFQKNDVIEAYSSTITERSI